MLYTTKHKRGAVRDYLFETPNLRVYFNRLQAGNPLDIRTPLFNGMDREVILSMWDKIYQQCKSALSYPGMDTFEADMRKKVGPMSVLRPLESRMPSIFEYFTPPSRMEPISEAAIMATCEHFQPIKGIRLRSPTVVVNEMDQSRYSGTPFCTRKSRVTKQTLHAYSSLTYT